VCDEGRQVRLTPLEFKVLAAFVRHPNQVLSHTQLLEQVRGDAWGVSPDQVKLYVGYLRRQLDPDAPAGTPIETALGFGWRYREIKHVNPANVLRRITAPRAAETCICSLVWPNRSRSVSTGMGASARTCGRVAPARAAIPAGAVATPSSRSPMAWV
jgi:DNA-binding winged helix-turn-helix (wHTH) protein